MDDKSANFRILQNKDIVYTHIQRHNNSASKTGGSVEPPNLPFN